jgi:hypothetical protein
MTRINSHNELISIYALRCIYEYDNLISVMYECECNGEWFPLYWCMFIYSGVRILFVCTIRKSMPEVDCEVDEPNMFEDDPQETFEQGKWILPLHILFVPS